MRMGGYYLGCPVWSNKEWAGSLLTRKAKPPEFLKQYASVFNTVEGNTTFYALPKPETVSKWLADTPPDFRFCLKFPRTISHDKRLQFAEEETRYFFQLFEPLAPRLGPLFLQLPPSFGPRELPALEAFLDQIPRQYRYAVEVRHIDFFTRPGPEDALNVMLAERDVDRVIFDSRGVHSATPGFSEAVVKAQDRKPNLPIRTVALAKHPMVRYISHPSFEENQQHFHHWAQTVATWMDQGREPYVFIHVPDDTYAPLFAREFHKTLQQVKSMPNMPDWPGEVEPPPAEQLALFSLIC